MIFFPALNADFFGFAFEKATCYSSNTFPFANDPESWLNKKDENIAILDQEIGFLNRAIKNCNLPCNLISIKYGTNLVTQNDLNSDPKTCSKQKWRKIWHTRLGS